MLCVIGSISTNTGVPPTVRMTLLVATQEIGVVMTSSPGPMPAMRSATSMVEVPLAKVRTGRPPKNPESSDSNSCTLGPEVIQPDRSTSPTLAMVASSSVGRVNGMGGSNGVSFCMTGILPAASLRTGEDPDANQNDGDADNALHAHDFAKQVPGEGRINHIAQR